MKLIVNEAVRTAVLAQQPSEAVQKLHAAWIVCRMFPGAEELRLVREAAHRVAHECGGTCKIEFGL